MELTIPFQIRCKGTVRVEAGQIQSKAWPGVSGRSQVQNSVRTPAILTGVFNLTTAVNQRNSTSHFRTVNSDKVAVASQDLLRQETTEFHQMGSALKRVEVSVMGHTFCTPGNRTAPRWLT